MGQNFLNPFLVQLLRKLFDYLTKIKAFLLFYTITRNKAYWVLNDCLVLVIFKGKTLF